MECWVDEACAASSSFHHSITPLLHFSRGKHTASASAKRYRSCACEQLNWLLGGPTPAVPLARAGYCSPPRREGLRETTATQFAVPPSAQEYHILSFCSRAARYTLIADRRTVLKGTTMTQSFNLSTYRAAADGRTGSRSDLQPSPGLHASLPAHGLQPGQGSRRPGRLPAYLPDRQPDQRTGRHASPAVLPGQRLREQPDHGLAHGRALHRRVLQEHDDHGQHDRRHQRVASHECREVERGCHHLGQHSRREWATGSASGCFALRAVACGK